VPEVRKTIVSKGKITINVNKKSKFTNRQTALGDSNQLTTHSNAAFFRSQLPKVYKNGKPVFSPKAGPRHRKAKLYR
jgi:hypothetical protein